jgi:fluoroquinolone resistance protein
LQPLLFGGHNMAGRMMITLNKIMEIVLHEDKQFKVVDYSEKRLSNREFHNCEFTNCNFTKSDLSNNEFMDCNFKSCNFSLTILQDAGLKNIHFTGCKLMGIDFSKCNNFLFSVQFQDCNLDYSSFFKMKMKKTPFIDCSIKEVDFADTDLSMAVFKNCDLLNTSFMRTNLEKADLRSATNYSFDPDLNKIKKARFSAEGALGLLAKYNLDIE